MIYSNKLRKRHEAYLNEALREARDEALVSTPDLASLLGAPTSPDTGWGDVMELRTGNDLTLPSPKERTGETSEGVAELIKKPTPPVDATGIWSPD